LFPDVDFEAGRVAGPFIFDLISFFLRISIIARVLIFFISDVVMVAVATNARRNSHTS
jgi:hypothetical protein